MGAGGVLVVVGGIAVVIVVVVERGAVVLDAVVLGACTVEDVGNGVVADAMAEVVPGAVVGGVVCVVEVTGIDVIGEVATVVKAVGAELVVKDVKEVVVVSFVVVAGDCGLLQPRMNVNANIVKSETFTLFKLPDYSLR